VSLDIKTGPSHPDLAACVATLMVGRRVSAISNHEAGAVASSFETLASQAPQDEGHSDAVRLVRSEQIDVRKSALHGLAEIPRPVGVEEPRPIGIIAFHDDLARASVAPSPVVPVAPVGVFPSAITGLPGAVVAGLPAAIIGFLATVVAPALVVPTLVVGVALVLITLLIATLLASRRPLLSAISALLVVGTLQIGVMCPGIGVL